MSAPATYAIGRKAAQSIYYSFQQAQRIGRPLTHLITINFAGIAICPTLAVRSFQKLRRDRFSKQISGPPTGIYAFENVRDGVPFIEGGPGMPHNVHVHWAVHVPAAEQRDLEARLWAWVEHCIGPIFEPSAINVQRLGPDVRGLRGYLNKGAQERWAQLYGATHSPQGVVLGGRRTGVTTNIGPSERRAWDYAEGIRRQLPSLTRAA